MSCEDERIVSRIELGLTFVKASAGLYSERIKPMFSISLRWHESLTALISTMSLFSVFTVALGTTSNSHRLSVSITIGSFRDSIFERSFLIAKAMSKASANAIVSLPSTDRDTRFDL